MHETTQHATMLGGLEVGLDVPSALRLRSQDARQVVRKSVNRLIFCGFEDNLQKLSPIYLTFSTVEPLAQPEVGLDHHKQEAITANNKTRNVKSPFGYRCCNLDNSNNANLKKRCVGTEKHEDDHLPVLDAFNP